MTADVAMRFAWLYVKLAVEAVDNTPVMSPIQSLEIACAAPPDGVAVFT